MRSGLHIVTPEVFKNIHGWNCVQVSTKDKVKPMTFKWLENMVVKGCKILASSSIWADNGYYYITKANVYKIFFSAGKMWIGRLVMGRDDDTFGWITAEKELRATRIKTISGEWVWSK